MTRPFYSQALVVFVAVAVVAIIAFLAFFAGVFFGESVVEPNWSGSGIGSHDVPYPPPR